MFATGNYRRDAGTHYTATTGTYLTAITGILYSATAGTITPLSSIIRTSIFGAANIWQIYYMNP